MIIDRYLVRETLQSLFAVTTVLLLVFLGRNFARFLADAVAGRIPGEIVVQLLFTFTVSSLVILLPVALYIAILVAFGRMYRDSEVTAMAACGVGASRVIRTMMGLSLVFGLVVAVLSLYVSPWSVEQGLKIRDFADSQADLASLVQGKFQGFDNGEGVFYVESLSKDKNKMRNVFIYSSDSEKFNIYSSKGGYQEVDKKTGDRFLVLVDGSRYEEKGGGKGYIVHRYEKSAVRIEPKEVRAQLRSVNARSTAELWGSKKLKEQAELQWRLSMPLSAVLMSLLAVFLSKTTPRQGRYGKLFAGIVVYVIYYNLMGIGQTWIKSGVVPPQIGLWWIHLLILLLVGVLFVRQYGLNYVLYRAGMKP